MEPMNTTNERHTPETDALQAQEWKPNWAAHARRLERERDEERSLADRLAALVSKPASEWGWEKVDALTAWKEARND